MSHPYKTRTGGATVTVFVPYDCGNHCPFCINKAEYADPHGFSLEKIMDSIRTMDEITPFCDFVFTGGEPLADLDALQLLLDSVPATHRVFINTTLPVFQGRDERELAEFLNGNGDKLTCVNVSRHLYKYVEECADHIFSGIRVPTRINCVLFGDHPPEKLLRFVRRFGKYRVPIQFRSDYTKITLESLYTEEGDSILADLRSILRPTLLEGCRIRCNYEFVDGDHLVSYHKTLPYSTIVDTDPDGQTWDILYDVLIKQDGTLHSDWDGTVMDVDAYRRVIFEPFDLHRIF